jgi:P-type Ca2+ transporter type 2C
MDQASVTSGLSSAEAASRLATHGRNVIDARTRRNFWQSARIVLSEPMLLLLLLAAAVYLLLGDLAEGALLGFFAAITVTLVILQQRRSERALEALRALGAPMANVVRDGHTQRIPGAELVPGDLLLLDAGERVAADGVLLSCRALTIDESLLTGESVPVRKRARTSATWSDDAMEPGGDDVPGVYSGTLVTDGEGMALVTATGMHTRAGAIGKSLSGISSEPTRLQRNTGKLVRLFGLFATVISLGLLLFYGLGRGEWMHGLLSAIALAMALLPEEFPLALTVFFAIGAWRLAQVKVLARRSAVIETLGAATVLCVDKTGTLTENRMRIRRLDIGSDTLQLTGAENELPEAFHRLVEYAQLAARLHTYDPMDLAVGQLAIGTLTHTEHLHSAWPLEKEYGLTPELLAMSQVWSSPSGRREIASKGAPEAIADLCHLSEQETSAWMQRVAEMARDGLRVLAVAAGSTDQTVLPDDQHDFDFSWQGLIGFEDPLRASVPEAIAQAQSAGIEVKMITGDFPETARAIAGQAGIARHSDVLVGKQMAAMDDAALADVVMRSDVYARIQPVQKLRLVEALKARGEVVAMTGDGVNDAPALKAAHIGIAMGQRGSDVAREAAAMVLLDDDFGHLVEAVRVGRRIFDNLRKVMLYIVAIHIPIAGLAVLPLLFGLPPLLLPMHVVLIEMIIDPMCSIAFENQPAEADIMKMPPRSLDESLIGRAQFLLATAQGAVLLLGCLGVYLVSLQTLLDDVSRTLAFFALTAGNLMLVSSNASRHAAWRGFFSRRRLAFWVIALIASAAVALCLLVPGLRSIFGFAWPTLVHSAMAIAVGVLAGSALEWVKWHGAIQSVLGHRAGPATALEPAG